MKLFKKHTAGMKQYKEFKKCIGMIGKIEESADVKEAALTAGYIIGVVKERHDKRLITDSILKRDRFECQDCRARIQKAVAEGKWLPEKEKKIARAEQVHHIQELKEHPELALDNNNLISLCVRCHNIRHGRVPHKFKRKKKLASRERW